MSTSMKIESAGQFRLIADLLTEGFMIQDESGNVLMHNRAALNLLGLTEKQLTGIEKTPSQWKCVDEFGRPIPPDKNPRNIVFETKQEIKNTIIGIQVGPHSSTRWLSMSYRLLFAFDKTENIYVITNFTDVTSIQNQKTELAISKSWNQAVLDSAQLTVISTDTKGTILTFNRYAEKLLGYEADELINKQNPGIFHLPGEVVQRAGELSKSLNRKIEPGFEAFVARAKYQGVEDTLEWTYLHKNGSRIPVRLTVTAIRNDLNEIHGYLGIAKNLTAQKEQQKIQIEQKRLLDAHIHALNESAIVAFTDAKGIITYVNNQFEKITEYTKEELVGRTHQIINSGFHDSDFFKDMWKTINSKKIWRGEICNRKKSGELYWVDATIVPILDSYGQIEKFVAIRYDITSRKSAELALIQASKMSSLGEMASGIAHEINNPLAIIQGRSSTMLRSIKRDIYKIEDIADSFERIIQTCQRVAKIIKGLRTFSRSAENDAMETASLGQIIEGTLELCRERLGQHGVELEYQNQEDIHFECRATQISQVILNILNNAFDVVSLADERWIRIEIKKSCEFVDILISNSGPKIDPIIAQKVLEPFFTTKPVGHGTGLGLSIAKGIIDDHHGQLFVDLQKQNTCFVIRFPNKIVHCEQQSA